MAAPEDCIKATRAFVTSVMAHTDASHDYLHVQRVVRNALVLGTALNAQLDAGNTTGAWLRCELDTGVPVSKRSVDLACRDVCPVARCR